MEKKKVKRPFRVPKNKQKLIEQWKTGEYLQTELAHLWGVSISAISQQLNGVNID